jgi:multiple sugar transport system substrate-binding protein
MAEIEFSIITDDEDDLDGLRTLLQPFERSERIKVHLTSIGWETAWSTLLVNALHSKGPHVSHVGSTWSNTLGSMEALRPFTASDLAKIGAPNVFMPLSWQSVMHTGGERVWATPWTAYTFILIYRRDLLEKAGLAESTAFATPSALQHTLARLQNNGAKIPWGFPTPKSNPDLIHIAANWLWAAGGEFVSPDGKQALFAQPEALRGFHSFFELFRYIPASIRGFDYDQCTELFAHGDSAAMILGADDAISLWKDAETEEVVRENLAAAALPGIPWVGGDNLVIWKHALGMSGSAALSLVKYLTTCETQLQFAHLHYSLPVRLDALETFLDDLPPFSQVIQETFARGRVHASVRLWSRIEHQLGVVLNQIAAQVVADPTGDIDQIIRARLEPLAGQMNMLLKN